MSHYRTIDGSIVNFDSDDHPWITPDMVKLTEAEFAALQAPADRTRAQIIAGVLVEVRLLRGQLFEIADNLQGTFLTQALLTGNNDNAVKLEAYKEGLRNITLLDLTGAETEQDMRDRFNDAYKALRAALPAAVMAKFYQTLQ